MIKVDFSVLRQTSWTQYLLRFAIGGMVTVAAGIIAKVCGPVWGGLFLAFPAIFPATVTLVARHERERKSRRGLHGTQRGLDAAAVNATGAALGSVGLFAFATVACCLLPFHRPLLSLVLATVSWFATAGITWLIWKRRHHRPVR